MRTLALFCRTTEIAYSQQFCLHEARLEKCIGYACLPNKFHPTEIEEKLKIE